MRLFIQFCIVAFAIFSITSVSAATTKYELFGVHSSNGDINYPGLDFYNASAKLTIVRDQFSPEPKLTALDIVFPNAASLSVNNFKKTNWGSYRALVSGAWVFKEVLVEVQMPEVSSGAHVNIEVLVVEMSSALNPENENFGPRLLRVDGVLQDVTPSKVADTASAVVDGKRLNLSLKDRLGADQMSGSSGFVIAANWLGHGQKTLYLPAPASPSDFDFIEAVAIVLEEVQVPGGVDYQISVKYNQFGDLQTSPSLPLRLLLDQAYGPSSQP